MDAREIKDAESLQAWLESLPQETEEDRETARRTEAIVAHRCAMRVLPVCFHLYRAITTQQMPGPTFAPFRANLISQVCAAVPAKKLLHQAGDAAEAAYRFLASAALLFPASFPLQSSARAAAESCPPIASSITTAQAASTAAAMWAPDASDAQAAQLFVDNASRAFWREIARDFTRSLKTDRPINIPVWRYENPYQAIWKELTQSLLAQGDEWSFWVEWYENALNGRPQDYDLLTKIALIDPADWDKGADHVNALIQRIVEQHNLAKDARALKEEVAQLKERLQSVERRSHNNPPELVDETVAAQKEVTIIWAALDKAEQELEKPDPDPTVLARIGRTLIGAAKAIGAYCASLADIAVKRAVATVAVGLTGAYLAENAETIALFAERLSQFAKSLGAP